MQILRVEHAGEIVSTPLMRAGYLSLEPGIEIAVHLHEGAPEVFVFLSGRCVVETADETVTFEPGSAVYIPEDVPHTLRVVGDEPAMTFFVVAPNHWPTHTFFDAKGRRVPGGRELPWDGRSLPAPLLPDDAVMAFPLPAPSE